MTNEQNQYGHGIVCPFQRDGKNDFANDGGLALLRSDIAELIGIRGPTPSQPGELPWNTEIGSGVLMMKHRGMHVEMIRATAEQMTSGIVRRYEKRARPGPAEVVVDYERNKMTIRFSYVPIGSNAYDKVEFDIPQGN